MASDKVDPIDWSHPPPAWVVPPERLVHSINRCSSATAGIRSCNLATFSMRGNHLANAATQGQANNVSKFPCRCLDALVLTCVRLRNAMTEN